MKQRIISAIVLILVGLPPLFLGGYFLFALCGIVAAIGSYEFCCIRNKALNKTTFISMVIYIALINFCYSRALGITLSYIIYLFFLAIINSEITLDDICGTFMMSLIIAFAIKSMISIYDLNGFPLMIYLLIASLVCDAGAYFVGRKFGKHKLNERVSPHKTIEGAIGGWIAGAIVSFAFAWIMNFFNLPIYAVVLFSCTLPIVAQIGDLSFSLIKRNYDVKDFGTLIPGHGGILDRFDSLFFCLIYFSSVVLMLFIK